jgi:hypothetical protein
MLKYNIPFDRLFAIDKTYLFTSPWHKNVRHICPSGSIKSRKLTCDRGAGFIYHFSINFYSLILIVYSSFKGHEIWSTLRSDGKRGTFYVRTSEIKLANEQLIDGKISYVPVLKDVKSKKNISPGERSTLTYLYYMITISQEFQPGDVIICDGESSLSTPNVQRYLLDNDIHQFIIPSILHQLINPCDNSFHALFKMRYYRLISNMNGEEIQVKEKLQLAQQCYDDISDESIHSMFKRCGLIPNANYKDKRSLVTHLMSEGITALDRCHQYKVCLLAFLKWCRFNNLFEELCPVPLNLSMVK